VRRLLGDLRGQLAAGGLSAEVCSSVEIVLAEALNNIAEHAYPPGAPGPVELSARLLPGRLEVTLADTGRSLPDAALPPGALPDNSGPLDSLPEGGFGWYLIRSLTTRLAYERRDGRNLLFLTIPT